MAYSKEIKEQVFHDFENNLSVKEISEKYSISLTTLYKWRKEYIEKSAIDASKEIRKLMKQNKFDEAINICKKFPEDKTIQSQHITILMKQGKFDEAINICKKFPEDKTIQSQYITILTKQGKFDEAINMCKAFPEDKTIQSQYITILTKQGKFEEAIRVCKKFPEYEYIQSQYIAILIKKGNLKKAITICKKFPDNEYIQTHYVNILIKQRKLAEAISICERFPNNKVLAARYKYLCIQSSSSKPINSSEDDEKLFDTSIFTEILANIQEHKFEEIELEKLSLTIFQKKMLVLIDAYNQKLPPKFLKKKVQELIEAYQDNDLALQVIKEFLVIIKKPILDVVALQNLLSKDITIKCR